LAILKWLNDKICSFLHLPTPVLKPWYELPDYNDQIQFSLGSAGQERIYFYQDDNLFNSLSQSALQLAVVTADPTRLYQLNVYFAAPSTSYWWAAMPDFDITENLWVMTTSNAVPSNDWVMAGGLAHELGHTLGLYHTYLGGGADAQCSVTEEYLSDVFGLPEPGNCPHIYTWSPSGWFDPNDKITNNIMSGNMETEYESPMQAGQMHRSLAIKTTRRYVSDEVYDPVNPVILNNNFPFPSISDWTFDFDLKMYTDLIVPTGITLTVTCKLVMPYKGRIIVQPGGKLVVDGGTITTDAKNHLWKGIEVWGDNTKSQYPDPNTGQMYQGIVIIKNNGIIEKSDYAVRLWNPGDYTSGGGIIQATEGIFKNNRHAVEFISYHNKLPITGVPINNLSYFTKCTFLTNDAFCSSENFYGFISMWDVEGINIRGCSFTNSSIITSSPTRGFGIYTEDASYNLATFCDNPNPPGCTELTLDHTSFIGLYTGVKALNDITYLKTININDALFTNNSYGVYLKDVNNACITCSNFDIGPNTNCPNYTGIGIDLEDCSQYTIHENTFMHSPGGPSGANYIGIRVNYLTDPAPYNEIYYNTFNGINVGNQAENYNVNLLGKTGLYYLFNQFDANDIYDFFISGSGIAGVQGTPLLPPANCFSRNTSPIGSDINNQANFPLTYYYYSQTGNNCQFPGNTYGVVTIPTYSQNNQLYSVCGEGGAPSFHLNKSQIAAYASDFATNNLYYDSIVSLYHSLIDRGSTDSLVNVINSANYLNVRQLLSNLFSTSPYLSEESLKAIVDRYDIISDSILSIILSENPEELANQEFMKYLQNRSPQIPQRIINYLLSISNDTTNKTTLQKQIAYYSIPRSKDAYAIIRSLVQDTTYDTATLRTWLCNLHEISADYQVIDSWLDAKNTTAALALLDSLPILYNMNAENQLEYNNYHALKTIQAELIDQGKNIFQLDSLQLAALENIAVNGQGIAVSQAQNILEFIAYGGPYSNCAAIAGPPAGKDQEIINPESSNNPDQPIIRCFPNPAEKSVTFIYHLIKMDESSSIEISNINGQIEKIIPVNSYNGQVIWDTKLVSSGVYFYTLKSGKNRKTGKLDVIH
jgi:hypothetical protein